MMLTLFDRETLMTNHDASVKREGRKETADLMAFLARNGRTDDIVKASTDEAYLTQLLAEYNSIAVAK